MACSACRYSRAAGSRRRRSPHVVPLRGGGRGLPGHHASPKVPPRSRPGQHMTCCRGSAAFAPAPTDLMLRAPGRLPDRRAHRGGAGPASRRVRATSVTRRPLKSPRVPADQDGCRRRRLAARILLPATAGSPLTSPCPCRQLSWSSRCHRRRQQRDRSEGAGQGHEHDSLH